MQICAIPDETLARFAKKGFAASNMCFANCANIVFSLKLGNYVLCWVIDSHGQRHAHAVFEKDGAYFDPTLQGRSSLALTYEFVASLSRDELIEEMVRGGATYDAKSGTIDGYAPALMSDGTRQCIEIRSHWPSA